MLIGIGMLIGLNAYIWKNVRLKINVLSFYFKMLENKTANLTQRKWKKKVIKIRAEINKGENIHIVGKIISSKIWFFALINAINNPLRKLINKKMREFTKLSIEEMWKSISL